MTAESGAKLPATFSRQAWAHHAKIRSRPHPQGERGTAKRRKTNMSKQVLIDALKAIGLRAVDANQAVDTVTETIAGELRKGERFSIPGFGTFAVSNRAARLGRNPRTGEEIKIKASKGVRFKAGAKLKGSL
jgi:DNA-binding protein HU-beta